MSELDKNFQDTVAQINAKLKEATLALKEANRLKGTINLPALISNPYIMEEYDEETAEALNEKIDLLNTSELETEIECAGWSTSSSYC